MLCYGWATICDTDPTFGQYLIPAPVRRVPAGPTLKQHWSRVCWRTCHSLRTLTIIFTHTHASLARVVAVFHANLDAIFSGSTDQEALLTCDTV